MFIDGTYTEAHQHSAGAAGVELQDIGNSRAGRTTKMHLAVDAYGLPVHFELTGGEVHDCTAAPELITQVPATEVIVAGKGYDSQKSETRLSLKAVVPLSRSDAGRPRGTRTWIEGCIAIGIWLRTPLHA